MNIVFSELVHLKLIKPKLEMSDFVHDCFLNTEVPLLFLFSCFLLNMQSDNIESYCDSVTSAPHVGIIQSVGCCFKHVFQN